MKKKINCWIVTEGMAGTENQCLGVTEVLNTTPVVKQIQLAFPWNLLSPYLAFETYKTFTPSLSSPYPDLLITSGRKAIAAARYVKNQSAGKTICIHIQDPRVPTKNFDLVAVPAHDPSRGENILVTTAAPNRITPERLKSEINKFPTLARLRKEHKRLVTVLIGGDSSTYTLTQKIMTDISQRLAELQTQPDTQLLITTSRRTGHKNEAILKETLSDTGAYIWDGHGNNPYFAMLGHADYILVTADSTSMLSEAATTGTPVYRIDLSGIPKKRISKMHKNLENCGAVRPFNGVLEAPWSYEPLNDAKLVADKIKEVLKQKDFEP